MRNILAIGLGLVLAACSSPPPPLPPDTTGVGSLHRAALSDFSMTDAAMTCAQIAEERQTITAGLAQANRNIEGNRTQNQLATYIGGPALLATEGNYADKDAVQRLYARQDVLIKLAGVKSCPAS